jgi:Ca2+-binding RTX toxin-like protein
MGHMKRFSGRVLAAAIGALAVLALGATAQAATFSNPAPITIPATGTEGVAAPYPSDIAVSGLSGTVTDVNVTVSGFSHSLTADVGLLLVGPGGQHTVLMRCVAGGNPSSDLDLTYDDEGAGTFGGGPLATGSYKPADFCDPLDFTPPAPAGPTYPESMAVFDGVDPNGTWHLYVEDFFPADSGSISGGWSITLEGVAPAGTCSNTPATISGSGVITGTAGDDVIVGSEGADDIDGGGGNDLICAGGGDDRVFGGDGDDRVFGGDGNDKLFGQAGNDKLFGESGNDTVFGNLGDDQVFGNAGDDTLDGNAGNDLVNAGPGNDSASGGTGDDTVQGGTGDDALDGGVGFDSAEGGLGTDTFAGFEVFIGPGANGVPG